jgi:hypothetical protein
LPLGGWNIVVEEEIGAQRTHVLFISQTFEICKMAEQESKKIDENNVEETSDSETKTVHYKFDISSI